METSETPQNLSLFKDESQFYQLVYRASQLPSPGSDEARQMTVGSGRQLSMLLSKSSPLGAFSKILMESSAWASSEEFCHVWDRLDTSFGLSAFRLMPLAQNIEGTESSLWRTPTRDVSNREMDGEERLAAGFTLNLTDQVKTPRLWPTPDTQRAQKHGRGDPNLALAARLYPTPTVADAEGGGSFTPTSAERKATGGCSNLRDTVKQKLWPTPRKEGYDAQGKDHGDLVYEVKNRLWPTPSAGNFNDGESLATWEARREANKAKGINGNGQGMPLAIAAKLWPTPVVNDARNGRNATANRSDPNSEHHTGTTLSDAIRLLPTPNCMDHMTPRSEEALERAKQRGGCSNLKDVFQGSLNPRFVEELMGYEIDHTALKP